MAIQKVHAIVRHSYLETVEEALVKANIRGISVTAVKGYGDYKNFFKPDWKVPYSRIEIFTARAQEVADIIVESAHTGMAGDGIVAISPVDKLVRIRDRREVIKGEE